MWGDESTELWLTGLNVKHVNLKQWFLFGWQWSQLHTSCVSLWNFFTSGVFLRHGRVPFNRRDWRLRGGRGPVWRITHSADHLKGFRLRWSRKRRADEDDIVPSPSLVNSDVFLPDQQPTLNPPLSAATERDHTTSVTNAFLMEWSRQRLYCLGTTIACGNFWRHHRWACLQTGMHSSWIPRLIFFQVWKLKRTNGFYSV